MPTSSDADQYRQEVTKLIEQTLIDVTYSYKGHFKAAERYRTQHQRYAVAGAVLGFLSSGLIFFGFANLFPTNATVFNTIAIITAVGAGVFSTLLAQWNYADAAVHHTIAGNDYRTLSRDCHSYLARLHKPGVKVDDIAQYADEVSSRASSLGRVTRKVPQKNYEQGRQAIADGETEYSEADKQRILGRSTSNQDADNG